MKYAWIENGKVRDICEGGKPEDHYIIDIAANYDTQVPDKAKNGDNYIDGQWSAAPEPVIAPTPRTWNAAEVREGLSLSEKVNWDNNATPQIATAKAELQTPQKEAYTTEILQMLVDSNSISQQSMNNVLAEPITTPVVTLP